MTTALPGTSTRWFRRYRPVPRPRLRLVCLPHAGGGPTAFRTWAAGLPDDVELLSACYPGRQDRMREPIPASLAELADPLAEALLPLLDRPVALFGHSMGATVAYEVALRLERHGAVPRGVFVSGRAAPDRVPPGDLHRGADDALIDTVRRLDDVHRAAWDDPDLAELLLPVLRADYRMIETYRPPPVLPRLAAPVTAYAGARDTDGRLPDFEAWAQTTTGGFRLRIFPGGHFFLVPEEAALLTDLTAQLA